jgi:uncharacterized protein YqhQ
MAKQYYGGQAVIEGVMMRGRKSMAVAVRNPQGRIELHEEPLTARIYTSTWGQWPFVRGLAMLWDALGLGKPVEFSGPLAWTTVGGSLLFAVALFFLLPTFAARLLATYVNDDPLVDAFFEGLIRLVVFLLYLTLIGRIPEIKRVFGYHGAEHKTINAYEAGDPLTVVNVQRHSVQHTRCGTSFLLYVLVISILLFAPLTFNGVEPGWLGLLLRFITRILLIPIVAGIAYEIIRWSAANDSNPVVRALITPGLLLQKLTTREPDDSMVEAAIAALEPVLAADKMAVNQPIN